MSSLPILASSQLINNQKFIQFIENSRNYILPLLELQVFSPSSVSICHEIAAGKNFVRLAGQPPGRDEP